MPSLRRRAAFAVPLAATALAVVAATPLTAPAGAVARPHLAGLVKVSSDPYTDAQAQHRTEVEPDTFSHGDTIVAAFQVGRVFSGGASNIGWATSTDRGATWRHGFLRGTTTNTGGTYAAASDASVAYDARHGVWIVTYLGLANSGAVDVLASRSTTGGTSWTKPVPVAAASTFYDKNWTVCDNTPASSFYGHCYTEYDNANSGDLERMKTSSDGGRTWGVERGPADSAHGLGGQPVVQPDGTVIVPFASVSVNQLRVFRSTDGGTTWTTTSTLATVSHHPVAGLEEGAADLQRPAGVRPATLRESVLPSAEVDATGRVYVTWADCRFRSSCSSNDVVLSTSSDGTTWTTPARVPIDSATSGADHFTPGIGVDPSSSGATARVALTYYFYPKAACSQSTCQLEVGYISSVTGGATWAAARTLAGPMSLSWLPNTSQGRMFGDYISTSVPTSGNAYPVFPVARNPSASPFDVAMYAPTGGLPIG